MEEALTVFQITALLALAHIVDLRDLRLFSGVLRLDSDYVRFDHNHLVRKAAH